MSERGRHCTKLLGRHNFQRSPIRSVAQTGVRVLASRATQRHGSVWSERKKRLGGTLPGESNATQRPIQQLTPPNTDRQLPSLRSQSKRPTFLAWDCSHVPELRIQVCCSAGQRKFTRSRLPNTRLPLLHHWWSLAADMVDRLCVSMRFFATVGACRRAPGSGSVNRCPGLHSKRSCLEGDAWRTVRTIRRKRTCSLRL